MPLPTDVTNTLTITLPIPVRALTPNGRPNPWQKSSLVGVARQHARLEALNVMNRLGWRESPKWKRAKVAAVFYFATKRRRDKDNFSSAMKFYNDGFADAGIVENDSGFTHDPPVLLTDALRPRVEITITEIAE